MGAIERDLQEVVTPERMRPAKRQDLWDLAGPDTLGRNLYAFLICQWAAINISVSALAAWISRGWHVTLLLGLAVLLVCVVGAVLASLTKRPPITSLGYLLLAFPCGLFFGPLVATYSNASVLRILLFTLSVTVLLGMFGALIPASLEGWGAWLSAGLLILIVQLLFSQLLAIIGFQVVGTLTLLDWLGVLLFCAYIVYDLNRAMRVPYTLNNSILSGLAVYLDFTNVFVRLLDLLGKNRP